MNERREGPERNRYGSRQYFEKTIAGNSDRPCFKGGLKSAIEHSTCRVTFRPQEIIGSNQQLIRLDVSRCVFLPHVLQSIDHPKIIQHQPVAVIGVPTPLESIILGSAISEFLLLG